MQRRFIASAAAVLLGACASSTIADPLLGPPADLRCETSDDDRRWLGGAIAGWRSVRRDFLKGSDGPLPQIVVYDGRCAYTLTAAANSAPTWLVAEHRGEIALPNGGKIPPAPNAFNAVTDAGHNFVVIALPSIWAPVAPKSEIPLEWFLEGVLFHELAHAYQSSVTPDVSFPALLKRLPATPDVNDYSIQEAFGKDAAYVRDYELERDLLFRAASAADDAQARALACDALTVLRARRARHFTGSNAHCALVDEVSLTTEGLGQWVAYKWLTERRGLAPSLVLSKLRGPYWSQDEGLALLLLIDRLVPRWQSRLFSPAPQTAEHLLAAACGSSQLSTPSRR